MDCVYPNSVVLNTNACNEYQGEYTGYRIRTYKNVSIESERCTCRDCGLGTFKNVSGESLCTSCVIGQYQDLEGQTSCQPCEEGKTSVGGASSCIGCPEGQSSTNGICYGCPSGQYEENNTCHDCPIGTYSDQTGQTSCTTCPDGQYQDLEGQTACKPYQNCSQGTYTPIGNPETGVVCQACPRGRYSDQRIFQQCKSCPLNTFQNQEGQVECLSCPSLTYTVGYASESIHDCLSCGIGSYFNHSGSTTCETFDFQYDYSNAVVEYITSGSNENSTTKSHCIDVLGASTWYDDNRPIGCTRYQGSYLWNTASIPLSHVLQPMNVYN